MDYVTDTPPRRLSFVRWFRIAARQGITHATGIVVIPIALLALAPFGYVYAFYQNATVQEDGERRRYRAYLADTWEQARVRPMENHLIIWLLSPIILMLTGGIFFLVLPVMQYTAVEWTETIMRIYALILIVLLIPLSPLGMIVAGNVATMLRYLPELLRMFAGIESAFTVSVSGMFTPTFYVLVCGLTYLCLDPFVKAAYVLRCFRGESVRNGRDLRVRLNRFTRRSVPLLFLFVVPALLLTGGTAGAQGTDPAPGLPSTSELDEALDRVLETRDYAWRAPRERPTDVSAFGLFMRSVTERIAELWRGVPRARKAPTPARGFPPPLNWMRRWIGCLRPGITHGGPRGNGRPMRAHSDFSCGV